MEIHGEQGWSHAAIVRDGSPITPAHEPLLPMLLPDTAPLFTVRHLVLTARWDELLHLGATSGCAFCRGHDTHGRVRIAERWGFQDGQQMLLHLVPVCPLCHLAMAWDIARLRQCTDAVAAHACTVNGWQLPAWDACVHQARRTRQAQRLLTWSADLDRIANQVHHEDILLRSQLEKRGPAPQSPVVQDPLPHLDLVTPAGGPIGVHIGQPPIGASGFSVVSGLRRIVRKLVATS